MTEAGGHDEVAASINAAGEGVGIGAVLAALGVGERRGESGAQAPSLR
jgi:hypothetical protein